MVPFGVPNGPGGIRVSVADLRRAAELERAREPKGARRLALTLGLVTGWGFEGVKGLRQGDIEYIVKRMTDGSR